MNFPLSVSYFVIDFIQEAMQKYGATIVLKTK